MYPRRGRGMNTWRNWRRHPGSAFPNPSEYPHFLSSFETGSKLRHLLSKNRSKKHGRLCKPLHYNGNGNVTSLPIQSRAPAKPELLTCFLHFWGLLNFAISARSKPQPILAGGGWFFTLLSALRNRSGSDTGCTAAP